ncbi:MAG: sugar ABC transporter substrate-binding protein [Spirochaetales bacterium]|nr:sugar ABC transporter substrate-binding protein [Spirochaetales bacterium]
MRSRLFIAFNLVLIVFSLSAAGQGDTASAEGGTVPVRFTTWTSNDAQLQLFYDMADEFNAAQSEYNIDLTVDSIPFGDYVSKITLQLSGSNPPDIGWLVETSAPTFMGAGILEDLSADLAAYDADDFSEGAMGLWTKGGAVYGVPFSTSPFLIIYNKTIFDEAGIDSPADLVERGEWTWEAFRRISKEVKDLTGVYGFQGIDGAAYGSRVWHNLIPMIRAYGGEAWDANGNVKINSAASVEAVQLFHDMVYRDKSVVPPGDLSDFYAGNAAMTSGQISRVSKLKDVDWEWDIAPLPKGPAGDNASYTIGQAAVVAFSSSHHTDAARAFLAFMTNKDNVEKLAVYWPPARESVMNSSGFIGGNPSISLESMVGTVVPGLKYGRVLPFHEKFPQISLSAAGEFDRLWNPDADVQAVMDSVAAAIKAQM